MPRPRKPRPPSSVNGVSLELYRSLGLSDEEIIALAEQSAASAPPPSTPFSRRAAALAAETRDFPDLAWADPAASPSAAASAFSAERFALDDSPIPPAELDRFYRLAARVFDLKPWRRLRESQIVELRLPGGRTSFLAVRGFSGTHPVLRFFPDFPSCRAVLLAERSEYGFQPLLAVHSVWQWQLAFRPPEFLHPGEKDDIDRLVPGLFPPAGLASAVSCAPGWYAARCGGRELATLNDALETALALFRHRNLFAVPRLDDLSAPAGARYAPTASGQYRLSLSVPFPTAFLGPLNLPTGLLAAVRALPVLPGQRIACTELLELVRRDGCPRFAMDRCVCFHDEATGVRAAPRVPSAPGRPYRFSDTLETVARHFLSVGALPGTLSALGGPPAIPLRRFADLCSLRFDPARHSRPLLEFALPAQDSLLPS